MFLKKPHNIRLLLKQQESKRATQKVLKIKDFPKLIKHSYYCKKQTPNANVYSACFRCTKLIIGIIKNR
jgi:hypothetical protein